ncbi:hypothetical protein EV363DRAFT_1315023 [Boletus edulis]|uniref:Uncharacterized protein n=1 Tax=Boletus edulis BED1 TaxID=1328754 RepID=A0AAD4GDP8_BOLED|nr:hypothetical protein EV363DRAFT_1315023 [Boletus edulis]KAF8437204.1 hypothetical protein L210DRAFT_3547175 [Boletus edulis BED1]
MVATKRGATDTGNGASSSKKSRIISHSDAQALVKAILANPDTYPILDDDDAVRRKLVKLAQYARDLVEDLESASQAGPAPKTMTPEQLASAVEKLRKAVKSGITKQMGWKPSCKTGSAKWVYDGVCTNPVVFGTLLELGGPPSFKTHKMDVDKFNNLLGQIQASVRYDHLYITGSHVNIRWSDGGEFKFSGTYGKWQPSAA